jgi:lipoprotein-anchoring transpeptidase ErfK/SrfK
MTMWKRLFGLTMVAVVATLGLSVGVGAQEAPVAPVEPPAAPAPPPAPPTVAFINLSVQMQRVFVYGTDGSLMREFPVSSGRGGRTPLGNYRIYSRSQWTTSSSDRSVSMQWMTRFRGGIGFHGIPRKGGRPLATPLGVRPVSNGCVRMNDADAAWIYFNVPNGTPVNVIPK